MLLITVHLYWYIFRYAQGRSEPPIDDNSQLTQMMAMNRDGMMMMQFMRPIVTNDAEVGIVYSEHNVRVKYHVFV